ncbi:MAG TPA: VWA domain-containing protein [Kineosporiaceae bacterium]|nr:VWA domain-containing protein [Kineosporiaceae bacterium]
MLAGLLAVAVVGAAMIKMDAVPDSLSTLAARAPLVGAECPSSRLPYTTVTVTVAPELAPTVKQALNPILTQTLSNHECVRFAVTPQEPAETVQSAAILPPDRAPDLWIPDSSLWESRVPKWRLNQGGSFATTPVVIATSQKAVDALGWTTKNPTWSAALAGTRPLAVPRIAEDAAGLSAVIALWQSLGGGDEAQRALAGAVLATGRDGAPTAAQAIKAAEAGSASAPLLPTSMQAVTAANKAAGSEGLVTVKPTGGSPLLDYPVLTILRPTDTAAGEAADTRERAVRAVVSQLLSSQSTRLALTAGFAVPESGVAVGVPTASSDTQQAGAKPSPVVGLASKELAGLVDRITSLSAPSKFLAIFDLSGSMLEPAGNGQNRIAFAAAAAKLTGDLLTDRAQIGFWGFSRNLKAPKGTVQISKDIIKVEDIAELSNGADSHREQLHTSMDGAGVLLGGNGTALYSAALAGMTEMTKQFDPRAGNAVVLFTDGANNDKGGPKLKAVLKKLAALYNPDKPVRLMCIGIGDDVDTSALRALSNSAGGQSFLATEPGQLPQFLFDVMNRR